MKSLLMNLSVPWKMLFTYSFMCLAFTLGAQEICDNGIDDDNDGFIDLNDDECSCSDIRPLDSADGLLCGNSLTLIIQIQDAISYQWFRDGVAIAGQVGPALTLVPGEDGIYQCRIITPNDCILTEPYDLVTQSYMTDLGVIYLCPGGCFEFAGAQLCTPGTFSKTFKAEDLCDSIVVFELKNGNHSNFRFRDTICSGQTFDYYDISTNVSGSYTTIIPNSSGCDSTIRVDLAVLDQLRDTARLTICMGDTLTYAGLDIFDQGVFSAVSNNDAGCEVLHTIYSTALTPTSSFIPDAYICEGDTFRLHGIEATASGSYITTINNLAGCDSTITVDLNVIAPVFFSFTDTICTGDTYVLNGNAYTQTGLYVDTIPSFSGCDSIIGLDLHVFDNVDVNREISICQGEEYNFYGDLLTFAGDYQKTITSPTGCDSTVFLALEVNRPSGLVVDEVICEGSTFTLHDIEESSAGIYRTTLTNSVGCDSVITVNLEVYTAQEGTDNAELCQGGSFEWNGSMYDTPGTYTYMAQTDLGCDSMVTLNLTAGAPIEVFEIVSLCQGGSIELGDMTITSAGSHTATLKTLGGCDSTVVLEVSMDPLIETFVLDTICQGAVYSLNGNAYNSSGTYSAMLKTPFDCDSMVTVQLHVNAPIEHTEPVEICTGSFFLFNDQQITTPGQYTTTLSTAEGCDSIVTYDLTISDVLEETTYMTLCEEEFFQFNEHMADSSGIYTSSLTTSDGCDSIAILDLTVTPLMRRTYNMTICDGETFTMGTITANTDGVYTMRKTNEGKCDSIITVELEVNALGDHIDLGDSYDVTLGYSTDIFPNYLYENMTYLNWYDSDGMDLGTEEQVYDYTPLQDTWVYLEGEDDNGCPAKDSVFVRVSLDITISFPNIISVDGNGHNDNFILGANNAVTSIEEVFIYDRWGDLVHNGDRSDVVQDYVLWDGKFNGSAAAAGVYVYKVKVGIIDGSTRDYYGDLTVLR